MKGPKNMLGLRVKRSTTNQGFTLIEVMVAALLLLVAVAGIVPLFLGGLSQASSLRYKSIATNIARQQIEEIRQRDYREIKSFTKTVDYQRHEDAVVVPFHVSCVVDEDSEQGLKKVAVQGDWTGPPRVSAAFTTTLFYRQFLGPRGAYLEVRPTVNDPLNTPFRAITGSRPNPRTTTVLYHIAEVDWGLVYDDLNNPGMAKRPVYMRLEFVDDQGAKVPIGESETTPDGERKIINNSFLQSSVGTDGMVNDVWFEYAFDANGVPDGYWEIRATAYNERDEPGNTWRLRVRVEMGPPLTPTPFEAVAEADNETVVLTWKGGPERDRDHFVLERRAWDWSIGETGDWQPLWTPLALNLDPIATTYTDEGSVSEPRDPWGNSETQNYYQYRIWGVDICEPGLEGEPAIAETGVPSLTTTTTLPTETTLVPPTTSTSTTSTTLNACSGLIVNTINKTWNVTIRDGNNQVIRSFTVGKMQTFTVSDLPVLPDTYDIIGTTAGRADRVASFTMPDDNGKVILELF